MEDVGPKRSDFDILDEEKEKTGYTPVKNRESFIQKKIRLLNEQDETQNTALENLPVRPVLYKIQLEQKELQELKDQSELEKKEKESLSPEPKVKRTPSK